MAMRDPHLIATRIIRNADGELVGRTRLQKVAYLTQLAGFGDELEFEYRHYGPFSDDLARGMAIATAFGQVREVEKQADWGGRYSIFTLKIRSPLRIPRVPPSCRKQRRSVPWNWSSRPRQLSFTW